MSTTLSDALDRIEGLRALVVGEAMLDSYLRGRADRMSREAPVPVVALDGRVDAAGGAANTAVNLASLGAQVTFASVVGTDEEGERVRATLRAAGIDDGAVLAGAGRRTLAKQRVLAGDQMLLRFDSGTGGDLPPDIEDALIEVIGAAAATADVIVISDYAYGVVGERVLSAIRECRDARPEGDRPPVVVDARDPRRYRRLQPTATKPNYDEAVRMLGEHEVDDPEARVRQVVAGHDRLLALTGARIVAVTLDRGGAIVLERGRAPYRTYAKPTANERACGAGDTFTATLALALAAGGSTPVAAELASAAAAVVVGKAGTATCEATELAEALGRSGKRIDSVERLAERVSYLRSQGQRIVFTNGCFDLLHRGHVTYLMRAKALGDTLIVAVNSDDSVRALKGPARPINDLDDRLSVLEALSCVDHVVAFDERTPIELVRAVRPDVYVKGGDYSPETLPEAPLVEELGGTVRILPYIADHSTTELIARARVAR
jgi:D-beta-D-heptose 7-phosphate kinase/D-beta-D-heptose 1-phosphate adenosyltransferase